MCCFTQMVFCWFTFYNCMHLGKIILLTGSMYYIQIYYICMHTWSKQTVHMFNFHSESFNIHICTYSWKTNNPLLIQTSNRFHTLNRTFLTCLEVRVRAIFVSNGKRRLMYLHFTTHHCTCVFVLWICTCYFPLTKTIHFRVRRN